MAEFHLKFHLSIQIFFFSKHQNYVILAIILSKVVLKTSVASMTSTASLAPQKVKKLLALYTLSDIHGIRILSSLNDLNSLSDLNDLDSLISSKHFLNLMVPSTLPTKLPILVSQCGMDHQNIIFY
jgi:hypothetical protein